MQPNDPQGLYQPGNNQPDPVEPPVQAPSTAVDPATVQAALDEPDPNMPAPEPTQDAPLTTDEQLAEEAQEEVQVSEDPVTWSAQEYIHQEKGAGWFVLFTIVVLALIGVSVWTQAWSFTALIVVIAVVVIVYSRRPPRELSYTLSDEGLTVQDKQYKFEDFKSFGVIRDGEEYSVMLIPTQRFQPGVTVYFPEEAGEDIVDMLGARLPMKNLKLDAVDKLVRLLRL